LDTPSGILAAPPQRPPWYA